MYINYNPNPYASRTGDCVVRAVAMATNKKWEDAYIDLCIEGLLFGDMPNSNAVWGSYLKRAGFERHTIPGTCPVCMTISEFAKINNEGTYILCTGSHAVCSIDGDYYDSWDSGDEVPVYFWKKEE